MRSSRTINAAAAIGAAAILALAFRPASATPAAPGDFDGDTIRITKGIDVPLVFDTAVSSKSAKKGDTVALHIANDVSIGDRLIFRSGTKVTAVITDVQHRKNFGVNAKLRIAFKPVETAFGTPIDLVPKSKGKSTGSRTDQAAAISGGGAVLLGPVGLVGGYFVVGKQVTIKEGDKIISEVDRDTDIVLKDRDRDHDRDRDKDTDKDKDKDKDKDPPPAPK